MNESHHVDVLVVGAGPAGSQTALELAERGHRVLVVENDPVVGVPMQCAGLVTHKLFRIVRFSPADVVVNRIRGAVIYSPEGREVHIDAGQTHAVVMDRSKFDQRVASTAQAAGADIWTNTFYESATYVNGYVKADIQRRSESGKTEHVTVTADVLVGADGVQSNVARGFGFPRPREFLPGYEAEMDGLRLAKTDTIPVFTEPKVAPGFFSWIIPVTNSVGRAGLCMQMRRKSSLNRFDAFRNHPQVRPYMTAQARVTKPIVGTVPLGLPSRISTDRVLLVGDAAAMPKPTSGGGIYTGLEGAVIAADVIDRALRKKDPSARALGAYDRRFSRSKIGRELRLGWRLRRAFLSLSRTELENVFRLLNNRRAVGVIDRFGDIDHPSHLLAPLLLAEPRLMAMAPKMLRAALRREPQQG